MTVPRQRLHVVAAAVACAVSTAAAGCTSNGVTVGTRRPAPATVAGHPTPSAATSPGVLVEGIPIAAVRAPTVAAALKAAHVEVPDGRLLAFVSHRILGTDGRPGRVFVDGVPAQQVTPLTAGDRVTFVAGPNQVEATRSRIVTLSAPNPSNLYVGGAPGRGVELVGVRSGEVAIRRVLTAPSYGHLVSPGAVALTFDDGPDPTYTPQLLALLSRAHVHATFCLIGKNAAKYPGLVREIVAAGNALCDHTWDHDERLATRPAAQIALDISRGAAAIRRAAGVAPQFFRAPGGNWSPTIEADARTQHMIPLKWTVDPRDWSRPGVQSILNTVYAELRPGGVILCHDGGGDRSQTLAAVKVLLVRLPAMGYHFVLPPANA